MQIENRTLSNIKPYKNNPRRSVKTIAKIVTSIKEFGFKQPLVLDKEGVIIVGHSRYLAAKELGLETVPCVIAKELTPQQIRAYRIADNRIAQDGEWDTDLLAIELSEINNSDFDFTKTGFTQAELESLILDPISGTQSLTSITEDSQKVQDPEFYEASVSAHTDEEYVNLNFTMRHIDRKLVFSKLNNIKDKMKLLTASDALVNLCKE